MTAIAQRETPHVGIFWVVQATEDEARLLAAIAKARGWIDDIRLGRIASFAEIAERESRVERHIRLLAPLAFPIAPHHCGDRRRYRACGSHHHRPRQGTALFLDRAGAGHLAKRVGSVNPWRRRAFNRSDNVLDSSSGAFGPRIAADQSCEGRLNLRDDLDPNADRETKIAVRAPLINGDFGEPVRILVPEGRA
jgi:hypothetical protein